MTSIISVGPCGHHETMQAPSAHSIPHGLDPVGIRDGLLREPLHDVGIYQVGFRFQQQTEELHPYLADTPFVPQQFPFLVTDVLRFDLPRLL